MTQALTSVIGDAGIFGVGRLITTQLHWYYRPQLFADVGIDVLVEPVLRGRESGRLLALQVKSGKSWRKEPMSDGSGWVFREDSQRHRDYWRVLAVVSGNAMAAELRRRRARAGRAAGTAAGANPEKL